MPGVTVLPEEDAFVALDWDTGAKGWSYSSLQYDTDDYDFGEGAVIYTYQGQKYMGQGTSTECSTASNLQPLGLVLRLHGPSGSSTPTMARTAVGCSSPRRSLRDS